MDADTPSPTTVPEFPFKPNKPQLRQIASALLVDSLEAMGHGLPSRESNRSALQAWFWNFTADFMGEFTDLYGAEAWDCFEQNFYAPPSIEAPSALDIPAVLAIRSRIRASLDLALELAAEAGATTNSERQWHVYRQAVYAHSRLQRRSRTEEFGRATAAAQTILRHRLRLKTQLKWSVGLTPADVNAVVATRLLGIDDLFGDFRAWCRLLKTSDLGEDWNSVAVDIDAARAALARLVGERAQERAEQVSKVLSELECIREMEHDIVADSAIDPLCVNLRIGSEVRVALGARGHLQLAPALPATTTAKTEEDWAQLRAMLEGDAEALSAEERAIYAGIHDRQREEIRVNSQSITAARCFVAWRGAPDSATHARREIPALLNSALRTAWLAMIAGRPQLEYFADQSWQHFDPWERGAEIKLGLLGSKGYPIARFPEEYPVANWLQEVLTQALPDHALQTETLPVANSVRLLNSADALRRADPAQSFCCSMAAVEVGLGGKGVGLADKIAIRMARLLVPDLRLRQRAIEVCKALYDIRSRVAHGDGYEVSERQAVFMRYVASCANYSLCGYLRAAPRFGLPANVEGVRKMLEMEVFVEGTPIGTTRHPYLLGLLERESELASWTTPA